MPLNPPTWKGPDVYYSTNVFVNKVPVALWQPPAGAFNDGGPGTRTVGGVTMYATNESGTQRFIKDQQALQGEEGFKDDTDNTPGAPGVPRAPNTNNSNTAARTSTAGTTGGASMARQPGDVELKIADLPNDLGTLNGPTYAKRISKYFKLADCKRQIVAQLGLSQKDIATNWINLCVNMLDPAFSEIKFGFNSGFRDVTSNSKAGGANRSDHMFGKAADLSTGSEAGNKKLFMWFVRSGLPFRQLLLERANGTWVHVAYDGGNKINEARRVMYINVKTGEKKTFGVNGEGAAAWTGM